MTAATRYVVLGLAPPAAAWWHRVAEAASAGPASDGVVLDAVRATAVEEVRARLRSGRPFSALLVDGGTPGLDRDLVELATAHGCPVVVVDDPLIARPGADLGAVRVAPARLDRPTLVETLRAAARPLDRWDGPDEAATGGGAPGGPGAAGPLVAVTGRGGVGTSVLAAGLAAGLAPTAGGRGLVLADLALDAQQWLVHGLAPGPPGLPELVEAHRSGRPGPEAVRGLCAGVPGAGHDLLRGIRRHRDWTALRPRALSAALAGLREAYAAVVADVGSDVEGEAECGSLDVEDRNLLARHALARADLVVVVGRPGATGVHGQLTVVGDLLRLGVPADRLVAVVNRAQPGTAEGAAAAAGLVRALAEVVPGGTLARPPVLVADHRPRETAPPDGPLPAAVVAPVVRAVRSLLDRALPSPGAGAPDPVPVPPGSLATFADEA